MDEKTTNSSLYGEIGIAPPVVKQSYHDYPVWLQLLLTGLVSYERAIFGKHTDIGNLHNEKPLPFHKEKFVALRAYLPYTFERIKEPGPYNLLLNRDYKPLGLVASFDPFVDYSKYSYLNMSKNPEIAQELYCYVQYFNHAGVPYFFDNVTAPWNGKKEAMAFYEKFKPFMLKYLKDLS